MKHLLSILTSFAFMIGCIQLHAQNQDENQEIQNIKLTINRLFEGMRKGDSAMAASTFAPDVNMYTSFTTKNGEKVVKKGSLTSFLKAIGTPHDDIWDEKIMNTKILVEGHIAQVWTDYVFYIGSKFSHCGVDAFHLIKDEVGWKIVHLMDTRRKEACTPTNN